MTDRNTILRTHNICKSFSGIQVLKDISIDFERGKVHALLGENGAGKSTLIKILGGVYSPTSGFFEFEGQRVTTTTPSSAVRMGIVVVHQELNLIPGMSVAENIFLGREITSRTGHLSIKQMERKASEILLTFGIDNIDVRALTGNLSIAEQQMVEIIKAISLNAKLLIFDEPTDVLTDKETEKLFGLIRKLREDGTSIIYISHRLNEIKQIADTFTVLRDGNHIHTGPLKDVNNDEIVQMMVARKLTEQYPYIPSERGKCVLEVHAHCKKDKQEVVSFSAYAGQIVTFYGLVGSGRTELMRQILCADKERPNKVLLNGKEIKIKNPSDANRCGIVYITESRKEFGIFRDMSVQFNISVSSLQDYVGKLGHITYKKELTAVQTMVEKLSIKIASMGQEIKKLSGGNQQKALLARSLLVKPAVLICDEPTRGIDVGAKVGIYNILNELKKQGIAIIVVSSDMPEVLGISDYVYTMFQGRINAGFQREHLNEFDIANAAFGKTG